MLTRLDLRQASTRAKLPRARLDVESAAHAVEEIVDAVRHHGAEAARAATLRFDGVDRPTVRVAEADIQAAVDALDPEIAAALRLSIANARKAHTDQLPETRVTEVIAGGTVTNTWRPVRRVGLYVPGGRAVYPSSVVMNVVPAQVAGVAEIVVASPPQPSGQPDPLVLAACGLLGVEEVYAVGGAQAIALLAYGSGQPGQSGAEPLESIEPVDLVTGPGNIWVAAAKRLVRGVVGIDSEAGPTEIAILADDTADPGHVAADLISQAEHDPMAASILVTTSEALADAVEAELDRRVPATKHAGRVREALTGEQSATVLVASLDEGLRLLDDYAAEHLEIQTADARAVAERVRNAGAVFVGPYAPVSLGDYCAGSNHVLPTGGCARHSGGLAVTTFLKSMQIVEYGREALAEVASQVITLAEAEDLPAHGEAITARRLA